MPTQKIDLGKYQLEWLNKYKSIQLNHWRLVAIKCQLEWYYVGDWEPKPDSGNFSYFERQSNLEQNAYYYWPKHQFET